MPDLRCCAVKHRSDRLDLDRCYAPRDTLLMDEYASGPATPRELVRLLTAGRSLVDAAREARVSAARVLRLLDTEPQFREAVVALLQGSANV